MSLLLGLDIGSTHCKAGLVDVNGTVHVPASAPTRTHRAAGGDTFIDPEELWQTVRTTLREVLQTKLPERVAAVGIASMAETGLLLDRKSGSPRTHIVPWFDTSAESQADF